MRKQLRSLFIFSSKENRTFFLKTIFVCMFVLAFCFVWMPRRDLESYSGALVDKINRLKTIQGPKIVLIGDSNVAFGIRSDLLEQAMGKPVVNLGYYGGIGTAFDEELAKMNVAQGDIYILCHMYYDDESAEPRKMEEVIPTLYVSRDTWDMIFEQPWNEKNWILLGKIIKAYPNYIRTHAQATTAKIIRAVANRIGLNLPGKGVYWRTAFNEYGDIAPGKRPVTILENDEGFKNQKVQVPGPETVQRWNELNQWLSARGATLLLAGYPIAHGKYSPPVWEFEAAQEKVKANVEFPYISNVTYYMFEYELFYDQNGHLIDKGAVLRTEQLIKDLRGWMEQTNYPAA